MSSLLTQPEAGPVELDVPEHDRRQGLLMIALAVGLVGFAMAIQIGLNTNFLREEFGVGGMGMGVIEAARESCGITALVLLALLAGLGEPLVAAAVLTVFAIGLGSYAFAPTFGWVVVLSLVWSQGMHIWMPLPNSMTLALAEPGQAGRRLGQVSAAGAAGFAAGLGVALLLSLAGVAMRQLYLLSALAGLGAAACCLRIPRRVKTPGPRLVLRRKYWLYYMLCFLDGWRRQIFVAFAVLLLIEKFETPVTTILLLQLVVQGIMYGSSRPVGRLIDRVGERAVLLLYFAGVSVMFALYSWLQARWALYAIYVLDSSFFILAMAMTTYVNRIAPKSEHTATLSMGVAVNHVAAVAMPLVGGIVWAKWGAAWTFRIGMAAAIVSLAATLLLGRRRPSDIGHAAA